MGTGAVSAESPPKAEPHAQVPAPFILDKPPGIWGPSRPAVVRASGRLEDGGWRVCGNYKSQGQGRCMAQGLHLACLLTRARVGRWGVSALR